MPLLQTVGVAAHHRDQTEAMAVAVQVALHLAAQPIQRVVRADQALAGIPLRVVQEQTAERVVLLAA
jgi:hypothetical protein